MFDAPLDAWYVWLGLSAVSLAVAGLAVSLPAATAPDAAGVADGIDAVAASPHQATDTVSIDADLVRLGTTRVSLQGPGGSSHATLAYGPVTPVVDGPLRDVLEGDPPAAVFESPDEFDRELRSRRHAEGEWRATPDHLTVLQVTWRDVDATLVG